MREPCDLLAPHPDRLEPATRRRVLDATLGELRRLRAARRVRATTALAATLAACLLLFALVPPPPQARPVRPAAVGERPPQQPEPALALEWQALDRPQEAKRLYFQAGERYFQEQDYAGALRCYGGALDAGTAEDLEAAPDDDYLLLAIKLARKKEAER
jgi:hypothetical protein